MNGMTTKDHPPEQLSIDQIARAIAETCGPLPVGTKLQLSNRIAAALKAERDKFDDKTNEALHLFGETQVKMIADSYEKAAAYTNLVIVAGYAGMFALWQFTKDHLSRDQTIGVAILLLVSIAIFVLYEMYKAYFTNRQLRDYAAVFQDPKNTASADTLISTLKALDVEKRRITIRAYSIWILAFLTTSLTGFGAALILAYAFIRLVVF